MTTLIVLGIGVVLGVALARVKTVICFIKHVIAKLRHKPTTCPITTVTTTTPVNTDTPPTTTTTTTN